MKKLMLVLVVLSVVFASCASPVSEPEVPIEPVNPFEGRWMYTTNSYITEWRNNTIIGPSGNIEGTFEYDDIYFYERMPGGFSHIVITWTYEFKNDGNELHLYFVEEKNIYGVIPSIKHPIYQKISD